MKRQSAERHSETFKYEDMKSEAQGTSMRDVGVGEMLQGYATPEEEKRVVLKLDLM